MSPETKVMMKQALISAAIGFLISVLTILFQATVEWLRDIDPAVAGSIVGIGKYLVWTKSHLHA